MEGIRLGLFWGNADGPDDSGGGDSAGVGVENVERRAWVGILGVEFLIVRGLIEKVWIRPAKRL
jgi:hypothetical protein